MGSFQCFWSRASSDIGPHPKRLLESGVKMKTLFVLCFTVLSSMFARLDAYAEDSVRMLPNMDSFKTVKTEFQVSTTHSEYPFSVLPVLVSDGNKMGLEIGQYLGIVDEAESRLSYLLRPELSPCGDWIADHIKFQPSKMAAGLKVDMINIPALIDSRQWIIAMTGGEIANTFFLTTKSANVVTDTEVEAKQAVVSAMNQTFQWAPQAEDLDTSKINNFYFLRLKKERKTNTVFSTLRAAVSAHYVCLIFNPYSPDRIPPAHVVLSDQWFMSERGGVPELKLASLKNVDAFTNIRLEVPEKLVVYGTLPQPEEALSAKDHEGLVDLFSLRLRHLLQWEFSSCGSFVQDNLVLRKGKPQVAGQSENIAYLPVRLNNSAHPAQVIIAQTHDKVSFMNVVSYGQRMNNSEDAVDALQNFMKYYFLWTPTKEDLHIEKNDKGFAMSLKKDKQANAPFDTLQASVSEHVVIVTFSDVNAIGANGGKTPANDWFAAVK